MKELAHLGLTYYSMLRTKRDFQTQLIFNKNHTFSKFNEVSEDRCNFTSFHCEHIFLEFAARNCVKTDY